MANSPGSDERTRNRLLRRVDWRFLLATPWPSRSACFADGDLASALREISGSVADGRDSPEQCDLAVAINPDRTLLKALAASLHAGGSCYTEWYWPPARGTHAVRRHLEAAGFEAVVTYWPWPWPPFKSPRFWLPLDAPYALDHFFATQPRARSPLRRAGRAALQALWRAAVALGVMVPVCAIARLPRHEKQPLPSASPDKIGRARDLEAILRDGWKRWDLGPPPGRLSWLLLTRGERSSNKVVLLIFPDARREPVLVVKLVRVPEATDAIMQETAILRHLHGLSAHCPAGIPRVLFLEECSAGTVLGETVVSGTPISTHLQRRNYRELALKATDWLARLATRSRVASSSDWQELFLAGALADFERSFASVAVPGGIHETRTLLEQLKGLPLVCEQRDFSPWNVLLDKGGELGVLDWESAEMDGLPATDLIYFMSYLAFQLDHAGGARRCRRSYRNLLDPATATGSVFAECLARYATILDLPSHLLPSLRLLTWLIHARSEYRRLLADAGGRVDRVVLKQSLFLALWEEELRAAHGG